MPRVLAILVISSVKNAPFDFLIFPVRAWYFVSESAARIASGGSFCTIASIETARVLVSADFKNIGDQHAPFERGAKFANRKRPDVPSPFSKPTFLNR